VGHEDLVVLLVLVGLCGGRRCEQEHRAGEGEDEPDGIGITRSAWLSWIGRSPSLQQEEVDGLLLLRPVSASDLAVFREELATELLYAAWPPDAEGEPS